MFTGDSLGEVFGYRDIITSKTSVVLLKNQIMSWKPRTMHRAAAYPSSFHRARSPPQPGESELCFWDGRRALLPTAISNPFSSFVTWWSLLVQDIGSLANGLVELNHQGPLTPLLWVGTWSSSFLTRPKCQHVRESWTTTVREKPIGPFHDMLIRGRDLNSSGCKLSGLAQTVVVD
jgi:hypothetical protein